MSSKHPIPEKDEVYQILNMLYGNDLELDKSTTTLTPDTNKLMVASFIDDENHAVTACLCDFPFAAYAGSALTKIPPGGAEDAASSGDFSQMMKDNLREIMNICSRLFMLKDDAPHLKFDVVYDTLDTAPQDVKSIIENSNARVDYNVSIPGYGNGALSFLCT